MELARCNVTPQSAILQLKRKEKQSCDDVVGEASAKSGGRGEGRAMPALGLAPRPFPVHRSCPAKASATPVSWVEGPATKGTNLLLGDLVQLRYAHGTATRPHECWKLG